MGPRHDTDEHVGESDMPVSCGPSLKTLIRKVKSTKASRQDDEDGPGMEMWREPTPGHALNFN